MVVYWTPGCCGICDIPFCHGCISLSLDYIPSYVITVPLSSICVASVTIVCCDFEKKYMSFCVFIVLMFFAFHNVYTFSDQLVSCMSFDYAN